MDQARYISDRCSRLLLLAQRGNSTAFAEFYDLLSPTIRDFAVKLRNELGVGEPDDVVQEVFLRLWQRQAIYRGEASAKTFVLAVTRRLALKRASRPRRVLLLEVEGQYLPAKGEELSIADETARAVRRALARLTAPQREAVDLALIKALPRHEALRLSGCGANQFQKRLQRAAQSLRRHLLNHSRHGRA